MKKGIAIGMLVTSMFALMGCQQKPVETTTPGTQQQTSTATIKITDGQETTTSTGTLEIKPATKETGTGAKLMEGSTLQVKPNY
jgi:hypothetical protein